LGARPAKPQARRGSRYLRNRGPMKTGNLFRALPVGNEAFGGQKFDRCKSPSSHALIGHASDFTLQVNTPAMHGSRGKREDSSSGIHTPNPLRRSQSHDEMLGRGDSTTQCNSRAKGACLVMIRCPVASVVSVLQHLLPASPHLRKSPTAHACIGHARVFTMQILFLSYE
jgi:hypothetical protein